ncbi:glycine N-acyltransferase-like protein 3 [Polyodon spathula]|uniref:glycine N-acyltransferase-like protein 3 n=1 Tax=Polyodon spathula TaxID=7913 RepID=UPI001B7DDDBD|nr:glycine N-acyltransferase-like protein 3 [Polyodon spathula]
MIAQWQAEQNFLEQRFLKFSDTQTTARIQACSFQGYRVDAFTKDEDNLRAILKDTDVLNWSGLFLLGGTEEANIANYESEIVCFFLSGIDFCHMNMMKEVAAYKNAPLYLAAKCFLMTLEDPDHLPKLPVDMLFIKYISCVLFRDSSCRITSLNMSHVDLVNKAWKFGGGESGARIIQNLISNFPSCCIVDESGKPVSWILTYECCAMGILYTLPEHRGKGYAKALVTAAVKSLHQQGYPIYCFIEEDNEPSYHLFKDLGFREVPDYRAVWFRPNDDMPDTLIS